MPVEYRGTGFWHRSAPRRAISRPNRASDFEHHRQAILGEVCLRVDHLQHGPANPRGLDTSASANLYGPAAEALEVGTRECALSIQQTDTSRR